MDSGIGNNKPLGTDASGSSSTQEKFVVSSETSTVSNLVNESTSQSVAATLSPTTQMMERDYDPNRIPASVFATKSPSPMEWSVCSNESLFSLHMGNNSFSRDHGFMMGADYYRPEESREFFCRDLTMSGEMVSLKSPPPLPTITESEPKDVPSRTANGHREGKVPSLETSMSINRYSDVSGTSSKSFAFPILTDGSTGNSVHREPEQQKQPPASTEKPKKASKSWFSCFSCRPKFCC